MMVMDYFPKSYIVNLPSRTDRRRQMNRMLKRLGPSPQDGRIEYFPAIRPESAGGFVSIGARGCFMSHLGLLKKARDAGLPRVLIMEDDLEITPDFTAMSSALIKVLEREDWGFAYFGHALSDETEPASSEPLRPYQGPIQLTHFFAINGKILPRVVDFLETLLQRPPGHPDGGPMHVDGAYSTFRKQNPDVLTLAARPNLGWQRSSKSDIHSHWFDSVPGLSTAVSVLRTIHPKRGPSRVAVAFGLKPPVVH